MAWLEFSHWMTGSECADWWTSLLRKRADSNYAANEKKGLAANTPVGFVICWADNSLNTAADMFVLDPARLGQGSGSASAGGSKWGVLADVGRSLAYVPLGKLVKAAGALRAGANDVEALSKVPMTADAVGGASKVPGAAQAAGAAARAPGALAAGGAHIEIDATARALLNTLKDLCRVPDPGGNVCWAVTMVRAIQRSGEYLMSLDDLARLIFGDGSLAAQLENGRFARVSELVNFFRSMNVPIFTLSNDIRLEAGVLPRLERKLSAAWQQCSQSCGGRSGWMMFCVEWKIPGRMVAGVRAEQVSHALLARVVNRNLQIFDRSGEVVSSLKALEETGYPKIASAVLKSNDCFLFVPDSEIVALKSGALGVLAAPFTSGGMLGPLMIPVKVIPSVLMSAK
jgi:hypothetical protein